MAEREVILRLYRILNSRDSDVENELRELSEVIKTRSQLNRDVEYITVSKISRGDVKGLIVIRGRDDRVREESQLLLTLVKSTFKSIDIEAYNTRSILNTITNSLKNFF
jgi:hypothetical protein